MSRSRLFYVLVPILIYLSRAHACNRFFDTVLSEQHRFLTFQQRGLPRAFVKPFYEKFLQKINRFSKKRYPKTHLSDICFTDAEILNFFQNEYKKSAIDEEVKLVEARFPHVPYIERSKQQDIPRDDRFKTASSIYFKKTMAFLKGGKISKAAALPRTVAVFYDPGRDDVLYTYFSHASHGPKMKASKLLDVVTGMVLSLEFMKVPRMYSVQILRHTVAWLSTVFRALQDDGPNVMVPVLFLPFYTEAYKQMRRQARLGIKGIKFTRQVVEEELGDLLEVYTRLDAWGRLEVVRLEDGSTWTIAEELFSPAVLKKFAEKIGYKEFDVADHPPYDADAEGMDRWEVEFSSTLNSTGTSYGDEEFIDPFDEPDLFTEEKQLVKGGTDGKMRKVGKGVRQADMCETPIYEYIALEVSTWEEACCASICCNSMLMMESDLSQEVCCGDCNQLECSISGSSLEVLAMVHLEPYGNDEGGAVPVSI